MNISLDFPLKYKDRLFLWLKNRHFSFKNLEYAFFKAEKDGISLILYKSGKLLIQGKESEALYNDIRDKFFKMKESTWMGTDEAGKGDYFGPLVVAGVIVQPKDESNLLKIGIKDSKRLSPAKIEELAGLIKKNFLFKVLIIKPEEYNRIYEEKKNLNHILSDAHIKVIKSLSERYPVNRVVVDKFSKKSGIPEYFKNKIEIEEVVGGERDVACAASSILARYVFEKEMREMSAKYQFEFPKGAGKKVREALSLFLDRFSKEELGKVAKLHFKLTKEVFNG